MTLTEAKRAMNAKAAELAALVRARHITYAGAENSIAGYAEGLLPGPEFAGAWKLYDYGIERFQAHHTKQGHSAGGGNGA